MSILYSSRLIVLVSPLSSLFPLGLIVPNSLTPLPLLLLTVLWSLMFLRDPALYQLLGFPILRHCTNHATRSTLFQAFLQVSPDSGTPSQVVAPVTASGSSSLSSLLVVFPGSPDSFSCMHSWFFGSELQNHS